MGEDVCPVDINGEVRLVRREQIAALEEHLVRDIAPTHGVTPDVRHYFAAGVYVREMHLPADSLVVGKLHKLPHVTVLVKGKITITTEEGSETLEAPLTLVAPPGIKRVGYCHTDVIWQSIHNVGEERDLDVIEERLIAKDFSDPALATEAGDQACLSSL